MNPILIPNERKKKKIISKTKILSSDVSCLGLVFQRSFFQLHPVTCSAAMQTETPTMRSYQYRHNWCWLLKMAVGGVQRGYRWTQALRGWAWRWWRGRWWSSEGRCGRGGRPLVESGGGSGTLGTMASLHLETFLLVLGGSSGPGRRILLLLRCLASALWPINCFSTLFSLSLFW